MSRLSHRLARLLRRHVLPLVAFAALLVLMTGCETLNALGDLSGLGESDQPVSCTITGTLVGEDGTPIERMDVAWYPVDQLSKSEELFSGNTDGNRFTIDKLVVATGATQVVGELGFNERIVPPNPQRYKQNRVEIKLPVDGCNTDLGTVTLAGR